VFSELRDIWSCSKTWLARTFGSGDSLLEKADKCPLIYNFWRKMMKRSLALIMVLSLVLLAACGGGASDGKTANSVQLIYTHYQPGAPNQPKQAAALAFEAYVEKASGGSIDVLIYPNSELGDGPAVLEAMQAGTIQMTVVHDGPISALYPPMGVYNMPFLFADHAEAWTIFDSEYTAKLGEAMRQQTRIRLLGMADNGIRHLTNSKRPIATLEDCKGLTIRIQPSPIYDALIQGLGANATAVAWTELPAALQQGVADGQENGITNILAANLYETQKFTTLDGHVYSYHAYLIADEFWNSLSEDQKNVVQQGVELAKWIHRGMTAYQDDTAKMALEGYGVQVTELSPQEIVRFRSATQPAVADWMNKTYGGTWVPDLLGEIDRIRGAQ
jgi:C4-dicarboxylate-binding protein DctP